MSRDLTEILAWTLVHFLWQGAVIVGAAGAVAAAYRGAGPQIRYALFCGGLAAMALAPAITLVTLLGTASAPPGMLTSPAAAIVPRVVVGVAPAPPSHPSSPWFFWLVVSWLIVVAMLSLRSLGGWLSLQLLTRAGTRPASAKLHETAARLGGRLGIRRGVTILTSVAAEVPGAIGWWRPVVLLPVSCVTSLTPEQLEQILAHELAHVRRHDYLVNLAQTAIENLLFYHPGVWWVSRQIRIEREHCCDDLAVQTCGDRAGYVRTLAALEELRAARPALLVAADGGSLLTRIERLIHGKRPSRYRPPAWLGALIPLAVVLASVVSVAPPRAETEAPRPAARRGYLAGLAEAGYTGISVDEVIRLKDHGVEPSFIKGMLAAGIGALGVDELIRLRERGVTPGFAYGIVQSGLTRDTSVDALVRMHDNGVRAEDMGRIHRLGFGPYSADEVIRLRQHGVEAPTFEALREAGAVPARVADAITFRENGMTIESVRSAAAQGFKGLSLEQLVKLRRAGII